MKKCFSFLATALTAGALAVFAATGVLAAQVTEEEAKTISLEHADVDKENISFMIADSDTDDGISVFEVEFVTKDYEKYEYKIQAEGGSVLSAEYEKNVLPSSGTEVSLDDAKEIALTHAGLEADQVTFLNEKSDRDDGRRTYEIEFYTENQEKYEYEIDGKTGEISSWEYDSDRWR